MSVFGKLNRMFSWKKKDGIELPVASPAGGDVPGDYGVIVEIEHYSVLDNEEKINEALRGKLKGRFLWNREVEYTDKIEPQDSRNHSMYFRRFTLSDQSDFQSFAQVIKTFDRVLGVRRWNGSWTMTATERREEKRERKRIAKTKRMLSRKWKKEREDKLAELKKLVTETERSDNQTYGPPASPSKLNPQEFEQFLASLSRCKVEVRVIYQHHSGELYYYEREVSELLGADVILFFEKTIGNTLKLFPSEKDKSFFEIPFTVEYRQKNGKRFARLICTLITYLDISHCKLFVRE